MSCEDWKYTRCREGWSSQSKIGVTEQQSKKIRYAHESVFCIGPILYKRRPQMRHVTHQHPDIDK